MVQRGRAISVKILRYSLLIFSLSLQAADHLFCLHGFLRTPRAMRRIERTMQREGWHVTNWGYPSRAKTIHEHADDLLCDLTTHAHDYPGEPINFATHSMGGLIVRVALSHPDCPAEAKQGRIVMIAPPNRGSQFGRALTAFPVIKRVVGKKAGKQLLHAESFLPLGHLPDSVDVLVVAGTLGVNPFLREANDGKVSLSETRLDTPHRHVTVRAGHSWISSSKATIAHVRDFLTQPHSPPAESSEP